MYSSIPWLTLQLIAIALGVFVIATRLPGIFFPEAFRKFWLSFPRSKPIGYLMMGVAVAWCGGIVYAVGFIEVIKPHTLWIWAAAAGVYALMVWLMDDFLAVRGMAVIWLLIARVMLDVAFGVETPARLVITVLAYIMIVAAMIFAVSPYRMRDALEFFLATNQRCRAVCAAGVLFGIVLIALGIWVY